jgi:hypothetical protein
MDWNSPMSRARVIVVGSVAVVLGIVSCVFAIKFFNSNDLGASVFYLLGAFGLLAVTMLMIFWPDSN